MKEELYIYTSDSTREKLDLPVPSGITLKWVNNLFTDISKLTCSHSYTFKLPITQNNVRVLDMANDIRHHSKMIRKRVDADFFINGVCLCPNANLYVSEIGDTTFSCVLTWRVLKAFETLKGSQLKLNELPSVGLFTWQENNGSFQYGYPSGKWSNMADLLYPDYDAGVPHEDGMPPKPVVPVYRLIQTINDVFGVKFDIGRQISEGMGILQAVNFNNKKFYGRCVYDDFVTYGVVPLTGVVPFLSDRYVVRDLNLINLSYAFQDGEFEQEGSYRRFTKQSDKDSSYRKYEYWRDIDVSKRHYMGGIATIADYPESQSHMTPVRVRWNEYIGTERIANETTESSVSEVLAEKGNMWENSGNGRYDGYEVYYAKRTMKNVFVYKDDYQYYGGPLTLKLEADCEIRGTATVVVKKSAIAAGRVQDKQYWWIYLLECTKDDKGEVKVEPMTDDGDDWLGLRSVRREESADAYTYYFDFGVEYEVRRLKLEAAEEDSLGIMFWSGYEYSPTVDDTQSVDDRMSEQNGSWDAYPKSSGLFFGYDDQNTNRKEVDFADKFDPDDVRFGSLNIASITPSLETVTKLPVEMDIMKNLPAISCFNFIKDVFYMNGALPRVDKDGKTIVAMYYNQLRDRMLSGECLDWSKKIISGKSQANLSKYENTSFGQRNYFEMAYSRREKTEDDKRDELELYGEGYGTVGIADALLDEEKALYKSQFFPGLRQDLAYPNVITGRTIKVWDGEGHVVTTTNPLYGYLNMRALDSEYEQTDNVNSRPMIRTKGVGFKHIRMNAFEPFADIDGLFGYLGTILEKYTCVKEKMLLTELDLRDFDESVPVYLNKYNSFFAVSSIQRDKQGVSTVELVQLPYVKVTYKDSEQSTADTVSYGYEVQGTMLNFTLNLVRDYTSNPCPLSYDIFVNAHNEGWKTTYNTLAEPLKSSGYYLSKWVGPYIDGWNGQPYTLAFRVYDKVSYKIRKTVGFDTVYETTLEAGLRVYYDDELLQPGNHTKTFTKAEDGQYHVFKIAFDVKNTEGETVFEYRKKLYYFVYSRNMAVIDDDWGEEHEEDAKVRVSDVGVTGAAVIYTTAAQDYTMTFLPSYANVLAESVVVTTESSRLLVRNVSLSGFTLVATSLPVQQETAKLNIAVTLTDGSTFTSTYSVKLQRLVLSINGAEGFEVANGTGYSEYKLVTTPTKRFTVQSVVSSSSAAVVDNLTATGFRLKVTDLVADITTAVTAVVMCEGIQLTATKNVTIKVKDAWSQDTLDSGSALIVDINGMFYTKEEWEAAEVLPEDADGIAVSDGTHRFIMAKKAVQVKVGGYRETGLTPIDGGYVINAEGTLVSGQYTTENVSEAKRDFAGKANTDAIIAQVSDTTVGRLRETRQFPSGATAYLGSAGQWNIAFALRTQINELLRVIGGEPFSASETSTQHSDKREWKAYYHGGKVVWENHTKNIENTTHALCDVREVTPVSIGFLSVSGPDSVVGGMGGSVSADFTLSATPVGAAITDVSVVAGSEVVTISEVSTSGFRATAQIRGADSVKLTVTARVNGLKRIVERQLVITPQGQSEVDYTKLDREGVVIVDENLNYYTKKEWVASGKTKDEAEGLALSDGSHRFIMAKQDAMTYPGIYFGGMNVAIVGLAKGKNYDGYGNTQKIIASVTASDGYYKTEPYSAAAFAAQADAFPSGKKGYLGSAGEWGIVVNNFALVQELLAVIGVKFSTPTWPYTYWTSNVCDSEGGTKDSDNRYAHTFISSANGASIKWAQRSSVTAYVRVFRKLEI